MQIKRDLKDYTTILLWRQDGHDVYYDLEEHFTDKQLEKI